MVEINSHLLRRKASICRRGSIEDKTKEVNNEISRNVLSLSTYACDSYRNRQGSQCDRNTITTVEESQSHEVSRKSKSYIAGLLTDEEFKIFLSVIGDDDDDEIRLDPNIPEMISFHNCDSADCVPLDEPLDELDEMKDLDATLDGSTVYQFLQTRVGKLRLSENDAETFQETLIEI